MNVQPDASPQAKSQPAGYQWKQQYTNIRIVKRTSCWEDALFITCTLSMCCQGFICDCTGLNKQERGVEQESWQEGWFKMNHPFSSHLRAVWRQSLGNWMADSTPRDPAELQEQLWPSSEPGNSKTKKYHQGLTGEWWPWCWMSWIWARVTCLRQREGFRGDGSVQAAGWFKGTLQALLLLQNTEWLFVRVWWHISSAPRSSPSLSCPLWFGSRGRASPGMQTGMKQPWKLCCAPEVSTVLPALMNMQPTPSD